MEEHVVQIVAAYVRRHRVDATELPALIASVNKALATVGKASAEPASSKLIPAVPIRRSVGAEWISCLECGKGAKMLKRHLSSAHGLTEAEYRSRWNLPADYPLVARNYAAQRSELAKSFGLGRRHPAQEGTPSSDSGA